jgi:hypothetical protein
MATTRSQDLQASINQATSKISSINSHLVQLETHVKKKFDTMDAKFMNQFNTLKSTVNQLLNCSSSPSSSDQPDAVESSHSLHFQYNSFQRDPRLPRAEVNKFDGSDPMGWVTQMEHYFSLHGITDELAKLRYDVLYLYLERWKW